MTPRAILAAAFLALACAREPADVSNAAAAERAVEPEGPRSFAEHVARQPGLVASLARFVRASEAPLQPLPASVCTRGERDDAFDCRLRVRSNSGVPVTGATVALSSGGGSEPFSAAATDAHGVAVLPSARPGDEVQVSAAGFVPVRRVIERVDEGVVVLEPGVEVLRVRVRAPFPFDDATPAYGARVTLDGDPPATGFARPDGLAVLTAARERAVAGSLRIHVESSDGVFLADGVDLALVRERPDDELELTLHSLRSIAFDVVDTQGRLVLDTTARLAWDPEHPARVEFPFGAPRASATARIGHSIEGVPPLVPLWIEVARDGRVLASQPLDPLPAVDDPRARPLFVVVASPPERVRASVLRLVDDRGLPCPAYAASLVRGTERVALPIDASSRVRVDEQVEPFELEVRLPGPRTWRTSFPARFDSAQIVELVVDAR